MSAAAIDTAIDPRILDEAADWLMQLTDGAASDADRAACAHWRQRSPEHARAWARAELLLNKLGGLPASLALSALDRPVDAGRRAALAKLAAIGMAIPAAWLAWRGVDGQRWIADHRTATGEQRALQLADGTQLLLNTATAIDIDFDATRRLIRLHDGEIRIVTGPDTGITHRRFFVDTRHGRLEALGTQFTVRVDDGLTRIAVQQSAVRITPSRGGADRVLQAGQKTTFDAHAIAPAAPLDAADVAWAQSMLLADNLRLADFATELARYRRGVVRCDPALANLKISGAYPVDDPERTFAMLSATYPIAVQKRFGDYWVTLAKR